MNTNQINFRGINVSWVGADREQAVVSGLLSGGSDCPIYAAQAKALEATFLAHFFAGVDVGSEAYMDGIHATHDQLLAEAKARTSQEAVSANETLARQLAKQAVSDMGDIFWDAEDYASEDDEDEEPCCPSDIATESVYEVVLSVLDVSGNQTANAA